MSFLLNAMSPYTCTRCGKHSVLMSTLSENNLPCCDGDKVVKHTIGHSKVVKKEEKVTLPTPPEPMKPKLQAAPEVMNPSAQPINILIKKAAEAGK